MTFDLREFIHTLAGLAMLYLTIRAAIRHELKPTK